MRLQSFLAPKDPHEPTSIIKHADGTPDGLSRLDSHFKCEEEFDRIVVTGKFPQGHLDPSVLVETIRDPETEVWRRSCTGKAESQRFCMKFDTADKSCCLLTLPRILSLI